MDNTIITKEQTNKTINAIHNNITPVNKDLAWKCVQDALFLKDKDLEFEARYTHFKQLTYGGYGNESAQFFPWFVKFLDNNPNRNQIYEILWIHKWVFEDVIVIAKISKSHIMQIFDEMKQRYLDYQASSERVISNYKSRMYFYFGEPKKAYSAFQKYKNADSAYCELDDCYACMVNGVLEVLTYNRAYKELLKFAEPISSGKLRCDNVPGATYSHLIQACIILGKNELSDKYALDACDKLTHDEINFEGFHFVLIQLALSKRFLKGREIIEKQLIHYYDGMATYYQMLFFHGCMIYFQALIHEGEDDVQLNLSEYKDKSFIVKDDANYKSSYLVEFFNSKANAAINAFDQRNGNTFFQEFFTRNTRLLQSLLQESKISDEER